MNKEELRETIIEELNHGRAYLNKDTADNIIIDVEQYANQRVIEELEKLKGLGITYTDDIIDNRIKELKQYHSNEL